MWEFLTLIHVGGCNPQVPPPVGYCPEFEAVPPGGDVQEAAQDVQESSHPSTTPRSLFQRHATVVDQA